MSTYDNWPVAFFDDDYLKIYRPTFTEERTRQEVDFIAGTLDLAPGARVLDLACGTGRHAIGMAGRGYRVTGVDFNASYLEIAAADAAQAGAGENVRFAQADMRALAYAAEFDAVYSYFTSFGYFSDAENETVIEGIACALAPGGRFMLEMMNRDHLLVRGQQRTWNQRPDGALLMEEVSLDLETSRVLSRQILIDPQGGPQVTKSYSLRAYTCGELRALLARHGLQATGVWGGLDKSVYSTDSRRLVLLAVKGEPAATAAVVESTTAAATAPGRARSSGGD